MTLDRDQLVAEHTSQRIQERLHDGHAPEYLPDFIYGAIDGTVTTFAVVSGVAGADLSSNIVIVLGLANLVGDGFSMAASNYLGTRVERQLHQKAREREAEEIDVFPEGEREEIRQIYSRKGFAGEDLERAVDIITSDRDRWIETMLTEEMGFGLATRSPLRAASATMVAFLLIGFIPLLAFVWNAVASDPIANPYGWSCLLTAIAFFAVGAIKSRFVQQAWYWSGLETLALGGTAASLAYAVGAALGGLAL
jgi:VIT1/CCC1 family predicted Fe2+/Mn2+ transporter